MTERGRLRLAAVCVLLTIHSVALWGGFVDFDDNTIFLNNELLRRTDVGALADIFDTDRPNWRPLRDLSHWLDFLVHGQTPSLAHLHNLALTGLVAWLAMAFLRSEAAVLLAFAHPVAVEPIAWVSGRKDLLAGVFFFAMLLAFRRVLRGEGRRWSAAVVLCFALAAMSKGHVLVAPAVLACVWWWEKGDRRAWPTIAAVGVLALALAPLVARGAAVMADAPTGAALPALTAADRLALPALYLWSLVWPLDLNHIYLTRPEVWVPVAGAVVLAAWLGALAKWRDPRLAIPLLLLLPYLHLIGRGTVYRADRYLFLALPFLGALVVPLLRRRLLVVAVLLLGLTSAQTHTAWHDPVSLWTRMTHAYPTSPWGYQRLGRALYRAGLFEEAAGAWMAASVRAPTNAQYLNNAGVALLALGRAAMARDAFLRALAVDPTHREARQNLESLR